MWVVKLGGSVIHGAPQPLLREWLDLFAGAGAGRVVVVPGGGRFADAVREQQARVGFSDLAAHNMAVLAMAQSAQLLHSLQPALRLASDADVIGDALRSGNAALWQPFDALRDAPDELTSWDVSADSLAAWLATRLGASRLVLVKWQDAPPHRSIAELVEAGYVDRAFDGFARGFGGEVVFVGKGGVREWRPGQLEKRD